MPSRPAGSRRAVTQPPPNGGRGAEPQAASILPYPTVAIGASVGGLHAFTTVLENLPPDTGMAFVLIVPLDPIHKSLLVSLLTPHTDMQVVEAADGMAVAPNTVFVIPPGATVTISGARLVISSLAPTRMNRWPIDSFFMSLAEDQTHHAICIVLSGAGSDGTRGLRAVKQNGGLTLAQAQDDGQAMTGMPDNAVASGLVDHLLPVSAMPAKLLDYQKSLRKPRQIDRLFHELLIGVTRLFRDPGPFHTVQETVLPKILAGKGANEQVRIWVPGCASGEEAYSLAILLKEVIDQQATSPRAQIFGTDIDEAAIATARAARYRASALAHLTPERRSKWFVKDGEFYRPVREIREMCAFSVHSVIDDPPFSKLDMISCRNLLIYLGSELQTSVIRNFHHALNPGGWLFLEPSESVAQGAGLFAQTDKRHRIFQRQDVPAALSGLALGGAALDDALDRSARRALEKYSPAYVVIDAARNIIRFSGGTVGRFLEPSPGVTNLNLFGILRKPLRRAVRAVLEKAIAGHETIVRNGLVLAFEGHSRLITVIAQPISDGQSDQERYLLAFRDCGPARGGAVAITFADFSEQNRQQTKAAPRTLNQTLERRVAERTAELQAANRKLAQQTEERQRAEAMLRQSQKMEAVGKLTGGIAHDFNNLLGVIIGNVEFLLDTVRDDPERTEQAREILSSALSGAELTRRLLAFASKQPLQPRLINLNTLLPNHVAMLGRTLGEAIHVTATLAPNLWLTHADPSQIGDALLNLALNARFAMPHGGNLLIETANAHLDRQMAAEDTEVADGDYVVLAVTDTGTGMPPKVIARATEPFFTTKPPTDGSGLGLSMIYGFARQSGGYLKIESTVGVGTTVRLCLPRAEDAAVAEPDAPDAEPPDPRGNEAILLVDDNPALRDVTQRHLIASGYTVRSVADGPAALAVLRSGATFDLLFTDVVMPEGLSGYDLADAARLVQPGLKILFTTGYAGDLTMDGNRAHDRQHMLRKPYQQRDLATTVRAVLDEA